DLVACFFDTDFPDFHHVPIGPLEDAVIIALSNTFTLSASIDARGCGKVDALFLEIRDRRTFQAGPWKVLHPAGMAGSRVNLLHFCHGLWRAPPVVELDRSVAM